MPAARQGLEVAKAEPRAEAQQAFSAAAAPRDWVAVVQWALVAGLLGALYVPVVADLAALWRAEAAYSHGPLIPMIAAYMVWQRRQGLREVPRRPCPAASSLLLAGLALLLVGRLGFEIHAAALSLVLVLGALVAMAGGPGLLRAALVPVAYLIFMIPLPWVLYFGAGDPLKMTTAVAASGLVAPLGIPMLREGTLIYLPTVTLEVESACSGVRTVMSLLPLAVAFAYLMVRRPWARAVLIASAVPIAITANILRVAEIIVQAHFFPERVSGYALHLYSAWIPMLFGLPMLFGVGGVIQWWERRQSSGSPS